MLRRSLSPARSKNKLSVDPFPCSSNNSAVTPATLPRLPVTAPAVPMPPTATAPAPALPAPTAAVTASGVADSHEGHSQIDSLPDEWLAIFRAAGVQPRELAERIGADPEMAKEVLVRAPPTFCLRSVPALSRPTLVADNTGRKCSPPR